VLNNIPKVRASTCACANHACLHLRWIMRWIIGFPSQVPRILDTTSSFKLEDVISIKPPQNDAAAATSDATRCLLPFCMCGFGLQDSCASACINQGQLVLLIIILDIMDSFQAGGLSGYCAECVPSFNSCHQGFPEGTIFLSFFQGQP